MALQVRKRDTRKRTMHIHDMLSSRKHRGLHHTLYSDLCADDKKFFHFFRMSKPSFEELLSLIENDITSQELTLRKVTKVTD